MFKNKKLVVLVVIACLIIGTILGTQLALADTIYYTLTTGWQNVTGNQSESPWWSYDVSGLYNMNAAKTTVYFDSIRYYNGSGDGYNPYFFDTWIYDNLGYHSFQHVGFTGQYINGINRTLNPEPDDCFDQMSASNDNVILQQYIKRLGSTYSDWVNCWTNQ